MNGLPYYKAYPRDFIEGTIGMSFELKAAYRLLLDMIYMQGGDLPDDPRYVSGLLGCSIRKWKALRSELIEAGKVYVSGSFLRNKRADKEVETLAKHQEKQAENRSRPNKNNGLESPPSHHTEPDTDTEGKREPIGSPKKRGSRLPDDWEPDRHFALREGLSELEIDRETDKFCDYWRGQPGQRGVKLDWQATWKNWVRKAVDDRQGRSYQPRPAPTDWRKDPLYAGVL